MKDIYLSQGCVTILFKHRKTRPLPLLTVGAEDRTHVLVVTPPKIKSLSRLVQELTSDGEDVLFANFHAVARDSDSCRVHQRALIDAPISHPGCGSHKVALLFEVFGHRPLRSSLLQTTAHSLTSALI